MYGTVSIVQLQLFAAACLTFLVYSSANGILTLSPSGLTPVCLGEELAITCQITNLSSFDFLGWNVTTFDESGLSLTGSRLLSAAGQAVIQPIVTNSKRFDISGESDVSSNGLLMITSVLSIDSVTLGLNGTVISCMVLQASGSDTSSSTAVIHVIGADNVYLAAPGVDKTNLFGPENVTVLLQFRQTYTARSTLYSVNIEPYNIPFIRLTYSSIQITLSYNTFHNVSTVARLCGHNSSATVLELHFVNCSDPLRLVGDDIVDISGYLAPALIGTNVTFTCPSSQHLSGPTAAVCTETGQWTPDIRDVQCTAFCSVPFPPQNGHNFLLNGTSEGSKLTVVCRSSPSQLYGNLTTATAVCNKHGHWEPEPSELCPPLTSDPSRKVITVDTTNSVSVITAVIASVAVFILSSIIFFILGFACGQFIKKDKQSSSFDSPPEDGSSQPQSPQQNVVYEDILAPRLSDRDLEMKEFQIKAKYSIPEWYSIILE